MLLSINRGKPPQLSSFLLVKCHEPIGFLLVHLRAVDCGLEARAIQKHVSRSCSCLALFVFGSEQAWEQFKFKYPGQEWKISSFGKGTTEAKLNVGKIHKEEADGEIVGIGITLSEKKYALQVTFLFLFKTGSL